MPRQFLYLSIKYKGQLVDEFSGHIDLKGDERRMRALIFDAAKRHADTLVDEDAPPVGDYAMEIRTSGFGGQPAHVYRTTETP